MIAYKVFTHDLRPPVQGGDPVWDGALPYELPRVEVDRSDSECAAGWNFCRDPWTALRVASLCPDGWPSRVFKCEVPDDAIVRADKIRAESGVIGREFTDAEIEAVIRDASGVLGEHAEHMASEQIAWRRALMRPRYDPAVVEAGLRRALDARWLSWYLIRYGDAYASWKARYDWYAANLEACRAACADWATLDGVWADLDAGGRAALHTARVGCTAWSASYVRDALVAEFLRINNFASVDLTTGLREAYEHGLATALPVAPATLGWSMVDNNREVSCKRDNRD